MAALGLCCSAWAFSSCSEQGLLSSHAVSTSHCSGFSYCRAHPLGHVGFSSCGSQAYSTGSITVVHGLHCSSVCGIFPDQGSNPASPASATGFFTTKPPGKAWLSISVFRLYPKKIFRNQIKKNKMIQRALQLKLFHRSKRVCFLLT